MTTPTGPARTAAETTDSGLLAFLNNTAPLAVAARDDADQARDYATLGEERPVHPDVMQHINNAARIADSAAQIGEELHPTARRQHDGDYARVETPRGGAVSVEALADAGRSHDDGAV